MNLEENRIPKKNPDREAFEIVDHEGKIFRFKGVELLETRSQGHDHNGKIYQAKFSLYRVLEDFKYTILKVALPSSKRAERLNPAIHVIMGTGLSSVLDDLQRLDLMQHVNLPHWVGSCAMLDYDCQGRLKIQADLAQGMADFIAACATHEIWSIFRYR